MADYLDQYSGHGASDEVLDLCRTCYDLNRTYSESYAFCRGCNDYFCEHCYNNHRILKMPEKQRPNTCQLLIAGCDKHKTRIPDMFCCEHCDVICKQCWHEKHFDCYVKPLSCLDSFQCYMLRNKQNEFLINLRAIKEQKIKDIEMQRNAFLTEISASYQSINAMLRKLIKRSKEEGEKVYQEQIERLRALLDENDSDLLMFDTALREIECNYKSRQSLNVPHTLADTLQRIKRKSKEIYAPTKPTGIPESWTKLGKYVEKLFSESNKPKKNRMQPDQAASTALSNRLDSLLLNNTGKEHAYLNKHETIERQIFPNRTLVRQSSVLETCVSKLDMLTVKTDEDKDDCCITGMCVTQEGCILMADCYNKAVKLFSQVGKYLSSCRLPGEPWDIALTGNNEAAVTLWDNQKTIELLHFTERSLQLKTSIRLKYRVCGIAAVDDLICVTCDDTIPSVKLIRKDGQVQWTQSFDSRGNKLFKSPGYIISDLKEEKVRVLVSDKEMHTITVIDARSGEINNVFSLSKTGPHGLAFDSIGNIFVGYSYSEGVCIYSADINEYKLLLSSEDKIKRPLAVVFNSLTNELLFSTWKSNTVERFKVL